MSLIGTKIEYATGKYTVATGVIIDKVNIRPNNYENERTATGYLVVDDNSLVHSLLATSIRKLLRE